MNEDLLSPTVEFNSRIEGLREKLLQLAEFQAKRIESLKNIVLELDTVITQNIPLMSITEKSEIRNTSTSEICNATNNILSIISIDEDENTDIINRISQDLLKKGLS